MNQELRETPEMRSDSCEVAGSDNYEMENVRELDFR